MSEAGTWLQLEGTSCGPVSMTAILAGLALMTTDNPDPNGTDLSKNHCHSEMSDHSVLLAGIQVFRAWVPDKKTPGRRNCKALGSPRPLSQRHSSLTQENLRVVGRQRGRGALVSSALSSLNN